MERSRLPRLPQKCNLIGHFKVMSYSGKMLSSQSDDELIKSYKATGEKVYVGELYKRYSHLVMGMCVNYFRDRDLAKDHVITIFEKLFIELQRREVEHFKAWLTFVVKNHCISELRKMKTSAQVREEFLREQSAFAEQEPQPEEQKDQIYLNGLKSAVEALNPVQRKCIELFYFSNMSYSQIVQTTSFSFNEVKSYIQNGKRNLKLILTQNK